MLGRISSVMKDMTGFKGIWTKNQLPSARRYERYKSTLGILVLVIAVTSCSGDRGTADSTDKAEVKKQPESSKVADRITEESVDHQSSEKNESVAQVKQPIELRNEPSDDEVAESEEATAHEFDDYAYVEQNDGADVKLIEGSEGYVGWHAPSDMAYSEAKVMVVAPDGERIQYSFSPNEAMVLDSSLPDGLYQWESVITPEIDPYVREQLSQARQAGDQQAERELMERFRAEGSLPTVEESNNNRQAGAFTVRDGVAMPTSIEDIGEDVE